MRVYRVPNGLFFNEIYLQILCLRRDKQQCSQIEFLFFFHSYICFFIESVVLIQQLFLKRKNIIKATQKDPAECFRRPTVKEGDVFFSCFAPSNDVLHRKP